MDSPQSKSDATILPVEVPWQYDEGPLAAAGQEMRPELAALLPEEIQRLIVVGVSGRYEGEMSVPNAGRYAIDCRIDIDYRQPNSPVMEKISGDIYRVYRLHLPVRGGRRRTVTWRVYRESWIVQSPTVTWAKGNAEITGTVHFWKGGHAATTLRIGARWTLRGMVTPTDIIFTESGTESRYNCSRKSRHFRHVKLEVDVCASVNTEPILPVYDTHAHSNRPADVPRRTLTIESAYREAGIDLTIAPERTIIDDSAAAFTTWTPAELHDAMEQYFSKYPSTWPSWNMWCLLAGTYEDSGVGGIMFDAAAAYGGAGVPPERQGCAVFRAHSWFNNLVVNPANDLQAAATRQLLYTYVHEIGHGFNFLHSWNKGRPDALSWMNYNWRYDNRNGDDSFWANFRFEFDDEELIHLRHGDRSAVIPGGDPWASGGHMESPEGAFSDLIGTPPVEVRLRSKEYFEFLEPVVVELRVKNTMSAQIEIDGRLRPEFGGVVFHIRRPDGRILEYSPVLCKLAEADLLTLEPAGDDPDGEDRRSQNIFLTYGSYGYYFDEPGEYLVRALYQGPGDILIPSNVHRVRIGRPFTRDEERIAQDYFSHETGMALYLNGSSSPFLNKGMETLTRVAEMNTRAGARMSMVLAQNLTRPFFRLDDERRLVRYRDADPDSALALTAKATEYHAADEQAFTNLDYHELIRTRADVMVQIGEKARAKEELTDLAHYLAARNVKRRVLKEITSYAKSL
jgi:hypothetical protein